MILFFVTMCTLNVNISKPYQENLKNKYFEILSPLKIRTATYPKNTIVYEKVPTKIIKIYKNSN